VGEALPGGARNLILDLLTIHVRGEDKPRLQPRSYQQLFGKQPSCQQNCSKERARMFESSRAPLLGGKYEDKPRL
jgi:hypothetical protein